VRDFDRSADRSIDRSGKEKKIKEGKASPHPRVTRTRDAASSDRGIDLAGGEIKGTGASGIRTKDRARSGEEGEGEGGREGGRGGETEWEGRAAMGPTPSRG